MLLRNRLKICLILVLLVNALFISHPALAQENIENNGIFTQLSKGEPAPFDSWCFNEYGIAKVITSLEKAKQICDSKLELELSKQRIDLQLKIDTLNIRISSLEKEKNNILAIKNREIKNLEKAALERPNDYSLWWATGGFVTGVVTVVSIVLITNNIAD